MFLEQFVDNFSSAEYIGAIGTLVVAIYVIYEKISRIIKDETKVVIANHLNNSTNVKAYIKDIEQKIEDSPNPSLYKLFLGDVLSFLDRHFGMLKVFSWKSFNKHITYSFIYSFLFFYISWLLGGDGKVGSNKLLPDDARIFTSLFLIFEILFVYSFFKNKITFFSSLGKDRQEYLFGFVMFLVFLLGVKIVGAVVGTVVGTLGVIIAFALIGLRIETGILAVGIVGIAGAGVFGLALFILIEGVNSNNILFILLYILFYIMLPLINSIFDYISMYFSRLFAQNILKTDSKFKVIIDVILDLVIAVLLLISLAFVLYYVIDIVNIYIIKKEALSIPIEMYKEQIFKNPFGKDVLWITMMFISTLIPTLLHLFLAIFSFAAFWITKPHLHTLTNQLKSFNDKDFESHAYLEKEKIAKSLVLRYRLVGNIRVYLFIEMVLMSVLVVVALMFLCNIGLFCSENILK